MKKTITGYHLGDRIDLKELKNNLAYNCIYADPTELMYEAEHISYFGIFDYGSIVFFGVDNSEQTRIINSVRTILKLDSAELKRENFDVEIDPNASYKVIFDRLIIKELSIDIAKIIMLNIAQSVALDYYIEQSTILLSQTYQFSLELEEKGKFSIKGKRLLKFIGRLLNLKNNPCNWDTITFSSLRLSPINARSPKRGGSFVIARSGIPSVSSLLFRLNFLPVSSYIWVDHRGRGRTDC